MKAALSWCAKNKRRESGLDGMPRWWKDYRLPDPTADEIVSMAAKRRPTGNEKFRPTQLGEALERHEAFCLDKSGPRRISPSIRWGFRWAALTTNRVGAATLLEATNIVWTDPHVPRRWSLVWWPAPVMKTRREFWLPIPPLGRHILQCVARDWRKAVLKSHGPGHVSKWAFPASRRIGRNPDSTDVVVNDSSLATHLANLRGKRQANHRDLLKDLPYFTIHTIRATASTFLINNYDLPPGAASALLGHSVPGDDDPAIEKLSRTTDKFYNFAQRIPLKIKAMDAWSKELLRAYKDAGGIYPE